MKGIYQITSPTGRVYIGQSWNIEKRFLAYRRLDCKKQPGIYQSLLKHGTEAHKFEVLSGLPSIETQERMDFWESYVICSYRKLGVQMLNCREGGYGGRMSEETKDKLRQSKIGKPRDYFKGESNPYYGCKHTREIRLKMSISNRGKKTGVDNGRARAIFQYNMKMDFLNEYQTIKEAAAVLNTSRQGISDVLNGRNKTAAGFIWKYKTDSK